jgi:tetratricopeptide (TPR) repeat protein
MQGDVDGAMAQWEQVIEIDPTHANAHKNLGIVYQEAGRYDEAIQMYSQYLDLAPDAQDREAVEGEIAELQTMAGLGTRYTNALGGYSLTYPEGWYYVEDDEAVDFVENEAAYEVRIKEAPMFLFTTGSLSSLTERYDLPDDTPVDELWQAMASGLGVTVNQDQVETFEVDGYPATVGSVSGTYTGLPFDGAMGVIIVDDEALFSLGMAPPGTWDASRSAYATMFNSLTFEE